MELYDPNKFYDLTKKNEHDKIWWTSIPGRYGLHYFSFDRKNLHDLWEDYPDKLTPEEKKIFDKENPFWADFFSGPAEG